MSFLRTVGAGVLGLLVSLPAFAQPTRPTPAIDFPDTASVARGQPRLDTDCASADAMGGTRVERAAWCAGRRQEFVSMRTLASKALEEDGKSYRANFLMGFAQHLGEGNLAKALYHLEEAEKLFIARHGRSPPESAPWRPYFRILHELVYVHGEMDHHQAKIDYVDALETRLGMDYEALKAWPLLKLKRYDDARQVALRASKRTERWHRAVGLTALCAVESEMRHRQLAYEACRAAADPVRDSSIDGAVELSNAGAAASEVFRFDEAERDYLSATRRPPEGSVNPWGRLVHLYLYQGRMAEALGAWRQMRAYRASRPGSYLDQQDQSEAELIGASVLLVAGRADAAEPITDRTVQRPDRQGTSSAAVDQNEAGAAIMDRVAKLTKARLLEEEASWLPWRDAWANRFEAMQLRLTAWKVSRRATEVLADKERLNSTLRPEAPGSLEMPAWLDAEVIELVGPGVALAAIQQAREEESLPAEHAEPIFAAFEAEAHWRAGDEELALERAAVAINGFSGRRQGSLLARVSAVAAAAAEESGQYGESLRWFARAMADDPQVIRRLGLRLPVRIAGEDNEAGREAADYVADSPLFVEEDWGFVLELGATVVRLSFADGTEIARARVQTDDKKLTLSQAIAAAAHRGLLQPDVDLTQADIRSLDGSLGSGGKAGERIDSILETKE